MKFFAVFAAVLAVAHSYSWTLENLSHAVTSPITSAALKPTLDQALDNYMNNIFLDDGYTPGKIITAAGVTGVLTLAQLDAALSDESLNPVFKPYLEDSLNYMMESLFSGVGMESVEVYIPAMELSFWTLQEIDAALDDPKTSPTLKPLLVHALNELMAAIYDGEEVMGIVVAAPIEAFTPISPIAVGPPASSPSASSPTANSPLVQIVLNVQRSQDVAVSPENVMDPAFVYPTPVLVSEPRKN